MRKILKFLHSRYTLATFCILLEFVQIMAVFILLYKYFLPITVLGVIFHVVVLLYIINRDEIPEFKLPWLILLSVLPVIGAFVFMLLSSTESSKQAKKEFENASLRIRPYWQDSECLERLKETDPDAFSQAHYLHQATGMYCYGGRNVTYYKIGQEFHQALLEELEQAEKYIFMEYFIIQDGRMWAPIHDILKKKAAQGIAVYLMYDDFGCMATLPERYYKQLEGEGLSACEVVSIFSLLTGRDSRKPSGVYGFKSESMCQIAVRIIRQIAMMAFL